MEIQGIFKSLIIKRGSGMEFADCSGERMPERARDVIYRM